MLYYGGQDMKKELRIGLCGFGAMGKAHAEGQIKASS